MNKIWNYALMAVLTVGLSFAATSCKDDDDNSGNNGNGTETVDDPTSLEEYQLRLVIANFAVMWAQKPFRSSGVFVSTSGYHLPKCSAASFLFCRKFTTIAIFLTAIILCV